MVEYIFYGIYKPNGKIDRMPITNAPIIFNTRSEALEFLNSIPYDTSGYYVDMYSTRKKNKKVEGVNWHPFGL